MKKITPYFFLAAALSAAVALSGCSGKSKTGMTPVTLNEVALSMQPLSWDILQKKVLT